MYTEAWDGVSVKLVVIEVVFGDDAGRAFCGSSASTVGAACIAKVEVSSDLFYRRMGFSVFFRYEMM